MHIVCPHCNNLVELADLPPAGEIVCMACGSTFRLAGGSTTNWSQRQLGRFEVLGNLGGGAFGLVYKARDPAMDRVVAIKVPRAGSMAGPDEIERFLREARSAAQLRHPSIVTTHEVGTADGVPFLVSEYVEGVTLADYLSGKRPVARDAARLVAEAAEALHHAHERGVVHRDVKPSNLMLLTDDDGVSHVKVMDFGLARRDAGEVTMTAEGNVLGTPAYMSPEQARGEAHGVDGRSDVYSLGVVLYQMLTGELPFRGTQRMLLHQVLHDEPRAPRALNDRVPRDLETVCLKAMAKEPARRYATAKELADDLGRWLRGEAVRARPVGRAEKAWRWCRRNPALAATTGLAATALVATAVALGLLAWQQARSASALAAKQEETDDALKASKERGRSLSRQLAESQLDRGIALCLQDEVGRGLLWLARALRTLPEGEADLERVIRMNLDGWSRELHVPTAWWPHVTSLDHLAFSRDGRVALVRGERNTARLHDGDTGEPIGEPLLHDGEVTLVAISPDGRHLLTSGASHESRLWDSGTSPPRMSRLPHDETLTRALFSPDGKTLVTLGEGRVLYCWECATGKRLGEPARFDKAIVDVVFRPDRRVVVLTSTSKQSDVHEFEPGRGTRKPFTLVGEGVRLSPDGAQVLVSNQIQEVRVYSASTGARVGTPIKAPLTKQARFVPADRPILAVPGLLGEPLILRDVSAGRPVAVTTPTTPGQDTGFLICCSPDGRNVLLTGGSFIPRLWDVKSALPVAQFPQAEKVVETIGFTPDGRGVVVSGDSGVLYYLPPAGSDASAPARDGADVAFGPGGGVYLAATGRIRDGRSARPRGTALPYSTRSYMAPNMAFRKDGRLVVGRLASPANATRVWDVTTGQPAGPVVRYPGRVLAVTFDVTQPVALVVGEAGTARFHDAGTGKPRGAEILLRPAAEEEPGATLPLERGFKGVCFDPEGRLALISVGESSAVLCETATGAVRMRVAGGQPAKIKRYIGLESVFSPDGTKLATGGIDGLARLWDVATGRELFTPLRHSHSVVQGLSFSSDGRLLVTTSYDRVVRFWDTATGNMAAAPLRTHPPPSYARLSPDDKLLLLPAYYPGTQAQLWDPATRKSVGPPWRHLQTPGTVSFHPDGSLALTGNMTGRSQGASRLWRVPAPLAGSPEAVELWARVLTRLDMAEDGTVSTLRAARWNELRSWLPTLSAGPALLAHVAPPDRTLWHRRQAGEAAALGQYFAARWHLDRLVEAQPNEVAHYEDRAEVHAERKDWPLAVADWTRAIELGSGDSGIWPRRAAARETLSNHDAAEADFTRAIELDHEDSHRWLARGRFRARRQRYAGAAADYSRAIHWEYATERDKEVTEAALVLAASEDRAAYREFCTRLRGRLGQGEAETASFVAWLCALAPGGVSDPAALPPLAERRTRQDRPQPNHFFRLALAQVRAGDFAAASRHLEKVLQTRNARAGDHFLLALCQAKTNNLEQARRTLDQARALFDKHSRGWTWDHMLEVQLLRREAEAVISPK